MISRNNPLPLAGEPKRTSSVAIALAWLVVSVPALWGVSQTIRTSMRLFERPAQTPPTMAAPTK